MALSRVSRCPALGEMVAAMTEGESAPMLESIMPIYEYVCRKCFHEFELLLRGEEHAKCPSCGDKQVEKQWSVPAAARAELPMASPPPGTCGRPQCGSGGCQFE